MTEDELLRFNPVIAKAFTQFESENGIRSANFSIAVLTNSGEPEKKVVN